MSAPINPIHQNLLTAIDAYSTTHGFPPPMRELMALCHYASTSVISYHLDRMVDEGLISRTPRVGRGIHVHRDE